MSHRPIHRRRKTILLKVVALLPGLILAPTALSAWGANGHRIVAKIGEDNLSDGARAAIRELAGNESLALLATWPDHIRSFPAWDCVKPWHFMSIDDGESFGDGLDRDPYIPRGCKGDVFEALDMPKNIAAAIDYFSDVLRGDEVKADRFAQLLDAHDVEPYKGSIELTALALVVHFVGDIHQPLHVGRTGDRGGNSVDVKFFFRDSNLHSVWDSGLIENKQLSYTEFADFLEQSLGASGPVDFGKGPAIWAAESMSHREQVYDFPGSDKKPPELGYTYAAENDELLRKRLYRGGRRLAALLEMIF